VIATVAERPAAWPARVERTAPGPQSAVASWSDAFAAAAALAEAATPSISAGEGEALTDGSPATEVATMAGGLAVGFAAAEDAVGDGAEVGLAAGAAGFSVGFAGLPFAVVVGFEVGTAVAVAVGAAVSVCDGVAGQQPVSASRPSTSAESRAARGTAGWYPASTGRDHHDAVPALEQPAES
jgi:hypothetical protein